MSDTNLATIAKHSFVPLSAEADEVLAYIHVGDIHMVDSSQQNFEDLRTIVRHINRTFDRSVKFVYIPGDIADDGSRRAYVAVRQCVDELILPWCGIVGDHDVHEESFDNFREAISDSLYDYFDVGELRFFRLNVFSEPRPDAFLLGEEQLQWLERELAIAERDGKSPVVLMHCYPSELKVDGERLTNLLHRFHVRLVDMGHTHYNEVSNDGTTLYTAARSTGQIEEGNAGYSLITFDKGVISWHFFEPKDAPVIVVTYPADDRLLSENNRLGVVEEPLEVAALAWSAVGIRSVTASVDGKSFELHQQNKSAVWKSADCDLVLPDGVYELKVTAEDASHRKAADTLRILVGRSSVQPHQHKTTDHDNALDAWEERGLLGTQLGPNKNGRKW